MAAAPRPAEGGAALDGGVAAQPGCTLGGFITQLTDGGWVVEALEQDGVALGAWSTIVLCRACGRWFG